jgi:hypothetical protein
MRGRTKNYIRIMTCCSYNITEVNPRREWLVQQKIDLRTESKKKDER